LRLETIHLQSIKKKLTSLARENCGENLTISHFTDFPLFFSYSPSKHHKRSGSQLAQEEIHGVQVPCSSSPFSRPCLYGNMSEIKTSVMPSL
jgi:hypothetical protein